MAVQTNGMLLAERYRVIRRLGSGGAATVYLCEDERLGRRVAVKRMHADAPEEMARRLQREARLGASLNHAGLVSVFDTVTDDEGVLIVMEYVEGETLAQALKRGPLPIPRALRVMRAVADALDHAHANGIVHRDVKPANILLAADGRVKLVDLGISTAIDRTQITRTGTVLGTPTYMAPEQLEGATPTLAVDVYALGAVAYEMLSGSKARPGGTPLEIAHRAATEPPPDLREAWPEAPEAAAQAIKRAMERDPAMRQRSATQLADELEAGLADPPTAPTRPLLGAPPPRRARHVPAWVPLLALIAVAAAAVLAIALGGSSGGTKHAASAGKSQPAHAPRKHKASRPAATTAAGSTSSTPSTTPVPAAQSGAALNDQGKALIDAGHPAQAIPILQRALAAFTPAQHSTLPYAWTLFNLADAYLKTGQPEKAIPLLRQRLKYPDQTGVVLNELRQAEAAVGQPAPPPGGKSDKGKKEHGKDH